MQRWLFERNAESACLFIGQLGDRNKPHGMAGSYAASCRSLHCCCGKASPGHLIDLYFKAVTNLVEEDIPYTCYPHGNRLSLL